MTPEQQIELARFPAALIALIEAEAAAGNSVATLSHGHPASPAGAYVMLARCVSVERRCSTPEISFIERHGSHHAGEFTTAERAFFVLEPPLPPPEPVDMDVIRDELAARERKADADRYKDMW